jgi:hypothetical protein
VIVDDGRDVGRLYEDRPPRAALVLVDHTLRQPKGITTNGRTVTLDQAKQQFRESWDRVRASPKEGRTRNLDTLAFQYARTRVAGCRRSFYD